MGWRRVRGGGKREGRWGGGGGGGGGRMLFRGISRTIPYTSIIRKWGPQTIPQLPSHPYSSFFLKAFLVVTIVK